MPDPDVVAPTLAALAPPGLAPTASATGLPTSTQLEADFAALFVRYHQRLVLFAARFVDRAAAEDAVQTVWVTTWRQGGWADRDDETQRRILYRAVRNHLLNEKRRAFREERWLARYWRDAGRLLRALSPMEQELDDRLLEHVERIVRRMPPRVREAWTLVRDHECDYAQAAGIMGIDVHTVGAHVARANRLLRDELATRGYTPATPPARRRAGRPE